MGRVRTNKFFKLLTIAGATLGVVSGGAFATVMAINATSDNFIIDELREYTASFYNEDTLISETTYKRGEELMAPAETPEHSLDGEYNYFFVGWDTSGNGLPDILPTRMYYSFTAKAVYMKTGKFDLSFMDLANMDLESLMDLLDKLNIDWEQFMDMFNIDPETLMEWLMKNAVLSFEADASRYIAYFRSTSFGDFNYANKSFNAPGFYDSNNISDGSINPLTYTADKLHNAAKMTGMLPETFDFVEYDITFNSKQDYYPVPDCELSDEMGEIVDSDAHYLKDPINNHYHTTAAYVPATSTTVDLLGNFLIKYSNNNVVASDEINYYNYALANYTSIPQEYETIIDRIIEGNQWVDGEYTQIESIGAYIESLGGCSMFQDGEVNLNYEKNTDPVMGLIENESGTDFDFNTVAVMIFRRLHIPARMVKGYVVPNIQQGTNTITLLNQHYWCEIYVKRIGWMICDCMNAEDFLGTNPYGELDKQNTPLQEEEEEPRQLERIEVTPPTKLEYYVGDSLDLEGAALTAFYDDDTNEDVSIYSRDVEVSGFDSSEPGEKEITVTYTDSNGVVKTETFTVTILQKEPEVDYVEFDTENMTQPFERYVNGITKKQRLSYYEIDPDTEDPELSKEGLKVLVHFKDNPDPVEPEDVSKRVVINGEYDLANEGIYEDVYFSVTYKEKVYSEQITIEVIKNRPISLTITKLPDDVEYFTGEKFDPTGIECALGFQGSQTPRALKDINRYNYEYRNADTGEILYKETYLGEYGGSIHVSIQDYTFEDPEDILNVELRYYFTDKYGYQTYVYDTFEIKVELNEIENAKDYDFKQTYELGTRFDEDEFVQNGYLIVDLENEKTAQLSDGKARVSTDIDYEYHTSFTVINDPDLGQVGDTFARVRYTYKDQEHTIDIPVTVTGIASPFNYVTDGVVPYAGPQDGTITDINLFSFTTSYVGTMYFTNKNYNTYSARDGWSMSTATSSVSPNTFAYEKISGVYNSYNVTVNYLSDLTYGVYPNYSNTTGSDGYHLSPALNTAISSLEESFVVSNFYLDENNAANRLINYTNYSVSTQSAYNSYSRSAYTSYSSDASDEIRAYIQNMGYQDAYGNFLGTYSSSNDNLEGKINLVLAVKNDLRDNFTYNNNFSYGSFRSDPAELFFTQTTGSGKFTGNSKNLATAATLIYRQLGIPARYVTGFGAQSNGGTTTVTAKNAHAWVEVWFDNLGWIIVDPSGYDTGAKLDDTGEYGHGFGGAGITNGYSLVYGGGDIRLTYNYADNFKVSDEPGIDWYSVYNNTDKHNIYTIGLAPGSTMPDYLEYKLYFEWTINDSYIGQYDQNYCPSTNVGVYTLTPVLRVFDRSLYDPYNPDPYHNEVTALYGYAFEVGTVPMEFYIAPLVLYVEVNPNKDTYSLSTDGQGMGQITISYSQVTLSVNNLDPTDEMWEYIDELPDGITVRISGSVTYTETGTVILDPDAFTVYLTDSYGNPLDTYSYAIIPIYGVITIEP